MICSQLQYKGTGSENTERHPSSGPAAIFIFDNNGVNSVWLMRKENVQYLPVKILETFTPDGVPVIVEGFKARCAVTDNMSGSDIPSSVSLSLKHALSLWGPNHKKTATLSLRHNRTVKPSCFAAVLTRGMLSAVHRVRRSLRSTARRDKGPCPRSTGTAAGNRAMGQSWIPLRGLTSPFVDLTAIATFCRFSDDCK